MQRLLFTLELAQVGPELRIAQTKCEAQDANRQTLWVSEMAETSAGDLKGQEQFACTKPVRALLLLLLQDLPKLPRERKGLAGRTGSQAASLYEVVIRGKARSGGKSWLQKMFTNPKTAVELPLGTHLFRHSRPGGRFFVGLGLDWDHAEVKMRLDGRPLPPGEYAELAALVKRWDEAPPPEPLYTPLTATLELLVRDHATSQFISVSEKPALLPVKHGDELQLRVRLSRPAYICLAWLGQKGQPFPMYPWAWNKFSWNEPSLFQLRQEVTVPDRLSSAGHSGLVVNGPPGIETLILMASLEVPGAEILKALPGQLSVRLPAISPGDLRGPVTSLHQKIPAPPQCADGTRYPAVRKCKDPVEAFHGTLAEPLALKQAHDGW